MENKFNFSQYNESQLLALAQDLLNRVFEYNLKQNYKTKNNISLDLVQQNFNNNEIETIVEVMGSDILSESLVPNFIQKLTNYIEYFKPKTLILIAFFKVEPTIYSFISSSIQAITDRKFEFFDLDWIIKYLEKAPDLIDKYNLSKRLSIPIDSEAILKITKNRSFFAVGHIWNEGEEDHIQRFIKDGIWEHGYEKEYIDNVNSVNVGDVLLLKSSFGGTLRIKLIGVVFANPKNGHFLKVNWHPIEYIDLPGLGAYRNTITHIGDENVIRILEGLSKQFPEIFEIIEKLVKISLPIKLDFNNNYFIEKYYQVFEESEFYFQRALDVLKNLKAYDELSGFLSTKDIKSAVSSDSQIFSYKQLSFHWNNRKNIRPSEFSNYLKTVQPKLVPLYELISKFISYVDTKSWNKHFFNEYEDKRAIAQTGVRQNYLVDQVLNYALNNFELNSEYSNQAIYRVIEYLQNPIERFNIVSEKHRLLISQYFLRGKYFGEEFHLKLISHFFQYSILPKNSKNRTCFYTYIIYDKSIRELWDNDENRQLIEGVDSGNNGIDPPDEDGNDSNDDESNDNNESTKERIPFHLDQVVKEDKLGRDPIAKIFAKLIKEDIFTENLNYSFMVHLQGEWGAGKSTFLNLITKNLNSGEDKWIVVNYNAWQNQHISPPWWTLIDQIYRQSKSEFCCDKKMVFWVKENFRRIIWYSGWQKILSLLLTVVFSLLLISYGSSIIKFITEETVKSPHTDNLAKGLTLSIFAQLIITLSSLFGIIYSFSKFFTTPFFMRTSFEAESFISRASDPMNKIKKHFGKLIDNINSKKEKIQLAIFIDDIDRCNKEFIVELLEGIQTLFKEKRVLYIVAGDKKWITTSFGNTYKEFYLENGNSHQLGELFLEKAFQLSFRMPNVSDNAKKDYWNSILGIKEKTDNRKESIDDLNEDQKKDLKKALSSEEDISNPDYMKTLEDKFNLTGDTVSNIVINAKNENKEEIKHLLQKFHSVINSNPRSIIRLANNYTMTRSILIAERKNTPAEKIFRWLIIEDLFPDIIIEFLKKHHNFHIDEDIKKLMPDDKSLETFELLLYDDNGDFGGALEMSEIKEIIGA